MKLGNLFLITALVGVVAAIGCTTESGNGNGNGGSGGAAADACTSGDCADSSSDVQGVCGRVKDYCNSDDCCTLPGTGGTGGTTTINPDSDTCDDVGQIACILGEGGTGGTGGTAGTGGTGGGGGTGGTGGTGGGGGTGATCDMWTGEQVCTNCDSNDLEPTCVEAFDFCLQVNPGGNVCEKCAIYAIEQCSL